MHFDILKIKKTHGFKKRKLVKRVALFCIFLATLFRVWLQQLDSHLLCMNLLWYHTSCGPLIHFIECSWANESIKGNSNILKIVLTLLEPWGYLRGLRVPGLYFENHWFKKYNQSVQLLSHVRLFATPWTAACQASLSFTNSQSLLKLMSIEVVMPESIIIVYK